MSQVSLCRSLVLALAAYTIVALVVALGSGSAALTEVVVWTESDLLLGLSYPHVQVLRLASDITMTSSASIPGASPPSGVYTLTRVVTITAQAGMTAFTNWYPTLDFSAVT